MKNKLSLLLVLATFLCVSGCDSDPYNPLIGSPKLGPGAREAFKKIDFLSDEDKQFFLRGEPIDLEKLIRLASSDTPEIRHLVAWNPSVSEAILLELVLDPIPGVRHAVATSKNSTEKVLEIVLNDSSVQISRTSISNPNWSSASLTKFYMDDPTKSKYIGKNPSTSQAILLRIVNQNDPFTARAVASNPSISKELAALLLKMNEELVNAELCSNASADTEVLKALSQDTYRVVRECAKKTLEEAGIVLND